jgi:PAS domain S-box-containing protein
MKKATGSTDRVSHGMCEECRHTFLHRNGVGLRELTNQARSPILVIDSEGSVLHANAAAASVLGRAPEAMVGKPGGIVIACERAQHGACGKTVFCDACRLREALKATHADGISRYGEVSEHPLHGDPEYGAVRLHFSVLPVNGAVVLLLERRERISKSSNGA